MAVLHEDAGETKRPRFCRECGHPLAGANYGSHVRRLGLASLVLAVVGLMLIVTAANARPRTRSCGFYSFGIGWDLRATPNLACARARRVFRDCAVARESQTSSCSEGFRCRIASDEATGISTERCVRGRKEVVGKGGP